MILHFSDTHLGYTNYNYVNKDGYNVRETDFYDSFAYVIDRILATRPRLVLHSGDFFHRPSPTNRAINFALQQLLRVSAARIPFVILAGNHSTPKTIYTTPILSIFEKVPYIYPIYGQRYETFAFEGVTVHGVPHINDPTILQAELAKVQPQADTKNILLLHTSLGKHFLMDEYGEQLFPAAFVAMLSAFDYVALGHWHNFQQVTSVKNAWYSGSTERMSESEIDAPKGICWLEEPNFVPTFEQIPTRAWYRLAVKNCHRFSIEDLEERITAFAATHDLEEAIISFQFADVSPTQSLELNTYQLKNKFKKAFHVSVKKNMHYTERFFKDIDKENLYNLESLFTDFVKRKYNKADLDVLTQKAKSYFQAVEFETPDPTND